MFSGNILYSQLKGVVVKIITLYVIRHSDGHFFVCNIVLDSVFCYFIRVICMITAVCASGKYYTNDANLSSLQEWSK